MEISPQRPRRSIRTQKRKESYGYEIQPPKRSHRSCGKAGCPSETPSCFAKATSGCAKDGYTSRWYHLSNREHFCNECFEYFYRSYKEGNQRYTDWKLKTAALFLKEISIRLFFAEKILDYWTVCSKCNKWRKVDDSIISKDIIQSWQCSKVDGQTCEEDEPKEVAEARTLAWIDSLSYSPLLKYSSPFAVLNEYYFDGIGFSAVSMSTCKAEAAEGDSSYIQPFYKPNDAEKFGCFTPDIMLPDEKEAFPELVKHRSVFLGLRNMAISLWNSSYEEYLSLQKCMSHLVIRGLTRITMCELLKRVLDFLTIKGRINFGIMSKIPSDSILNKQHFKGSVIVIGAGFAGLSAALRLKRAGCQVTVLEARSEIGGRVKDDRSLGICVSQGPQIITGCINNPVYVMCKQMNLPLRMLRPKCNLVNTKGEVVSDSIDQKVEFYFNLMLESIDELKDNKNVLNNKLSLKDCLTARKDQLEAQIFRELTEEEDHLLQFRLGNLEYACGATLDLLSALHWNQNESMLQFAGEHAWVEDGFAPLLEALSKSLHPQLSCEITDIDFSGDQVKVTDRNGKEFTADKAVVTVPLSILKKETIQFTPTLPDAKRSSISNLGAGSIEKVMLAFEKNFWKEKIGESDYFGRIPEAEKDRGLACLFYDVSAKEKYALMALLAGEAVSQVKSLTDTEIIERCMEKLRSMFPNEDIPAPYKHFVSHWGREEHIEMTYSYVGINGTGDDYDNIAESVDGKLYFAGEATNRRFPQTVTGAFISGLREAEKILLNATSSTWK